MSKLSFDQYHALQSQGLSDQDISKLADKYGYSMPSENIVASALKTLLVKPAARVAEVVGRSGILGENIKQGYENMGDQVFHTPVGDINVEKQKAFGEGGGRQIAADAFNSASYLAPTGLVSKGASAITPIAKPLAGAVASGVTSGYLGDIASNLTDGEKGLGIFKPGMGAVTGGALPVAGAAVKGAFNLAGKATKFSISQGTGLDQSTISTAITNPAALTMAEREGLNRVSVASQVQDSFKKKLSDLSATGKEYGTIRKAQVQVPIPSDLVDSVLKKHGITIDTNGKLVTTAESVPLKAGDISALEDFIGQYGKETSLTPNAFLNTRKALDNMSEWDASKSDVANVIAKDLRKQYDKIGKETIPGLSELDAKFAPEIKSIKEVRKNLFDKNGEMLDTTINRIANSTGAGKDKVLAKLEKIQPGITDKIKLAHALHDINDGATFKVGAYGKAGLAGFMATGGNIPAAIISVILAQPKVAIPILKIYGHTKNISTDVIERISEKLMKQTPNLHAGDLMLIRKALINHMANLPSHKFDDQRTDLQPTDITPVPSDTQLPVTDTTNATAQ
jgi:hypothetical protein